MNSRAQNLVVGAFVFLSLLILLFGIYFLKETTPGSKTDLYHARFDQVSTLQEGDPVKVNGVKMGRVTAIDLEDRLVNVTFELKHGIALPANSEIRIQNIGLMGERQMGIRLGTSQEILPPGGTLSGSLDAGIAEAMGTAGVVFIQADSLVRELRAVVDSTVARPEFASRVNALLTTTEDLTQRLSSLERDLDPQIREGVQTMHGLSKEMNTFARAQEPKVEEILRNGTEASQHAKVLAERGDRVAQGLEEVLAKVNSKEGTVGALLSDTALHRDLKATLKSADSLLRTINHKGLNVNLDLF